MGKGRIFLGLLTVAAVGVGFYALVIVPRQDLMYAPKAFAKAVSRGDIKKVKSFHDAETWKEVGPVWENVISVKQGQFSMFYVSSGPDWIRIKYVIGSDEDYLGFRKVGRRWFVNYSL